MPTWNPAQYLKFDDERTQPCRDLTQRIRLEKPRTIVDLGCGPGNSTQVLAARWPDAVITGIDSSKEMIVSARKSDAKIAWKVDDIGSWRAEEPVDIIFSNAAFQWVPDHGRVLPRLLAEVVPGGALAFQVPANIDAPAHEAMRELAASPNWKARFPKSVREWFVHAPAFYYDLLAPAASRVEMWTTDYLHVLDGPESIVEWYRGTGLRPFLDALEPAERERFAADYLERIARAYPRQPNGRVLFPFHRLFVIAYRGDGAVR
jgi:trans-aconitate 2-methyltransferase